MRRKELAPASIDFALSPSLVIVGKDELNLAEFPITAIADRIWGNPKALVFEDQITDASRGETITRQLTITASDPYGLPTAADDEVILGLVQLSKMNNFSDREVFFRRRELLRLLGWRDEGKSYARLEKSLNRWIGVTLYYKNAWWSKEQKCWVNEKFHILENVTLFDKARGARNRQQSKTQLSSFTWNKVIFRSFAAGNLKSIDFDFLKSLHSAVAKRLYRFLDKRFYHKKNWEFDLKQLCREHIGLSRNYDSANLKRALRPAIRELENRGFLTALPAQERFYKIHTRDWCVAFQKARDTKRAEGRKERAREANSAPPKRQRAHHQASEDAVRTFLESLSDTERRRLESDALAQANPIEIGVINRGGTLAAVTKKEVLEAYALKVFQKGRA